MSRRIEVQVWLGLLAAPAAWTVQHVLSFGVSEARCNATGRQWGISSTTWLTVLTIAAGLLALAGLAASLLAFRSLRDAGEDAAPPAGRARLMAVFGMAIGPIFLALVLLDGIGALLLDTCAQP